MTNGRLLIILSAVSAIAIGIVFIVYAMPMISQERFELQNPMQSMMQDNSGMMTMQAPKDVIILFQSDYEVPSGKQTEVVLKVIDKQTQKLIEGANVIIGIEKGLPMTTMDMVGGMFSASEKGNGTYTFPFTPQSTGYYTIHAHAILSGKQMDSMMENHVDLLISSN